MLLHFLYDFISKSYVHLGLELDTDCSPAIKELVLVHRVVGVEEVAGVEVEVFVAAIR